MKVKVRYFASLQDQAGLAEEWVETKASTPGALFLELRERHSFSLAIENAKVAINHEFSTMETALHADDDIVFIPPVAGG